MKNLLLLCILSVAATLQGQLPNSNSEIAVNYVSDHFNAPVSETVNIVGTVMLKGEEFIIHGTAGSATEVMDYYPSNLSRDFKVDGMRVALEATLDPIPDGVKLAGTPITIITIKKI